MGKRELLLILGFVVIGTVVYQLTASPKQGRSLGDSIGEIVDEIRREVRGRPASAEITRNATHPVPPEAAELRITMQNTPVTIVGEDRTDIATELWVRSNGVDEAEARSLAERAELRLEPAGPLVTVSLHYPPEGTQRGRVTLHVPSRMLAQFGPTNVNIDVSGIRGVSFESARGETIVKQIAGRVEVSHRGGDLTIEDVGSVRLSTRGGDIRLTGVRGETSLTIVSGEVRARRLFGPVEIDTNRADVVLDELQESPGPFRVTAVDGEITLRGLRAEARIEGRTADIRVVLEEAAPVAIFATGGDIEIVPPATGFALDAEATDGQLRVADEFASLLDVEAGEGVSPARAAGKVGAGGPTITVRATRGDVRINARRPE